MKVRQAYLYVAWATKGTKLVWGHQVKPTTPRETLCGRKVTGKALYSFRGVEGESCAECEAIAVQ